MTLTVKSLSVLLVWHGNVVVSTTVPDAEACSRAAEMLSATGFPSACVAKSCFDQMATSQPGWQVKCHGRRKEPSADAKKTPGVM